MNSKEQKNINQSLVETAPEIREASITIETFDKRRYTFYLIASEDIGRGNYTQVRIGVSVRSPDDADGIKKDEHGVPVIGKNGEPIMYDENVGFVIAYGKAVRNPNATLKIAGAFDKVDIDGYLRNFAEHFTDNAESYLISIQSQKKKRVVLQNKIAPRSVSKNS